MNICIFYHAVDTFYKSLCMCASICLLLCGCNLLVLFTLAYSFRHVAEPLAQESIRRSSQDRCAAYIYIYIRIYVNICSLSISLSLSANGNSLCNVISYVPSLQAEYVFPLMWHTWTTLIPSWFPISKISAGKNNDVFCVVLPVLY